MKANEVPEKLYFGVADKSVLDIYSTKERDDEIEYTRTDAFIEKAEKWLSFNLKMLMNVLDVVYNTHETDVKDFIEDFKNYMKGE